MNRYSFRAKDASGKLVTGEVEASSEGVAAKLVREKGLVVLALNKKHSLSLSLPGKNKDNVSHKDITMFTRQMATMINAGLPLIEALLILRNQSKGNLQKVIGEILADIEGGEALSKALEKHGTVFTPTYVALVKSGEAGGVLEKVLVRLADNMERQQEFQAKIKGAMTYPIIIVCGMVLVGIVMMMFVIPKMLSLYQEFGAKLPLPTQILITVSNLMLKFWPLFLLAIVVGGWAYRNYRRTPAGRRMIDELILKIPIIGPLKHQVILTEITRTLALMTNAGVSILEGLTISSGVVDNVVISSALSDTADMVEKGFPVAYSFAKHQEAFPYILSQMIAVGEETGKMDEVLEKVSHIFEMESNEKVKALTSSIEPLIMVVLGIGVGFLVIAVILPIYNLTSSF